MKKTRNRSLRRRMLSALLCAVLAASLLPALGKAALAADQPAPGGTDYSAFAELGANMRRGSEAMS